MKIKGNFFQKTWLIILFSIVMAVMGFYYVYLSARNIVFMDYWRHINNYIRPVMTNKLSLADIWESCGGQRNIFQNLLVVYNIKFFNLNCLWEAYAGIIVIVITGIILYLEWERNTANNVQIKVNHLIKQVIFLPVIFTLFNLNQWEILSLEFSFSFMVRILCFIISMFLTNKLLQENNKLISFFYTGIFISFLIVFLSQLYWVALLGGLFIVWLFDYAIKKKFNKYEIIYYWTPIILAIFLYFYRLSITNSGIDKISFFSLKFYAKIIMGFPYMILGSIVPQTIIEKLNKTSLILLSTLFNTFIIFSIFLFFKRKIYKKTYLPAMLIAYGFFSILMIETGRISLFPLVYLTASRYSCETTLIWVGVIYIYSYATILKNPIMFKTILCQLTVCLIISFVLFADYTEFKIAPYRGYNKDQMLKMIKNDSAFSDEELKSLQGNIKEIRNGIILMRKYSLNIFYEG